MSPSTPGSDTNFKLKSVQCEDQDYSLNEGD